MDIDLASSYRVRLRSLHWSTGLVKELRHSPDAEAVSVAVNWALDAVYDLFEVHRIATSGPKRFVSQDKLLIESDGEKLGGLLFIRGEKTHQAKRADGPSPFKALPYEFAKLTDWVWAEHTIDNERFAQRATWYNDHVRDRPLWVPLNEVEYWFLTQSTMEIPRPGNIKSPQWVTGVRAIYDHDALAP